MFCGLFTSLSSKLKSTFARPSSSPVFPATWLKSRSRATWRRRRMRSSWPTYTSTSACCTTLPICSIEVRRQVHRRAALACQRKQVTNELGCVHRRGHVVGGHAVHLLLALVLHVGEPRARVEAEHSGVAAARALRERGDLLARLLELGPERLRAPGRRCRPGSGSRGRRATRRRRSRRRRLRRPSASRRRAASGSRRGSGRRRRPSRRSPGRRRPGRSRCCASIFALSSDPLPEKAAASVWSALRFPEVCGHLLGGAAARRVVARVARVLNGKGRGTQKEGARADTRRKGREMAIAPHIGSGATGV